VGIDRLKVQGFKSLKDVTWAPGRLNVLIGPNGSGKSNLLSAISFIQNAARGDLSQEVLRQGGLSPLLWDGQAREISWDLRASSRSFEDYNSLVSRDYKLQLSRLGETSSYRIEHEALNFNQEDKNEGILSRGIGQIISVNPHGEERPVPAGSLRDDQTLLSTFTAPWDHPVVVLFRDSLLGWSVYQDIHVGQMAPLRQATVARVEERISPDGQNLIPVLHTLYTGNREFKHSLDAAMSAAFGRDYEELVFPPAADQRIQLRIRWKSLRTEQSAANLSDGTLRFLLLIAIFANPKPGDVIALDEPETGLHPSMLPIVAELAAEASQRTQVILSTHSADLLDAFSEVSVPTTTVASVVDGETRLSVIDGKELKRWLEKYRLGALMRSGELEGMV